MRAHLSCIGQVQEGDALALTCAFHYPLHLLPRHFCRRFHVSFCSVSLVFVLILHDMKGVGSGTCNVSSYFPTGLDIGLAKVFAHPNHWTFALVTYLPAMPMDLLAVIPVMLVHWVFHIFSWAFVTHLLYFYLLLCPWVCWLSFLPCLPIELFSSFPGIPRPIYFTFTSCCAYGSIGCYSCHVGPLDFLPLFLGFHDPFTLLLPFVVPISPLGVILTMLAHRVFFISFLGLPRLIYFALTSSTPFLFHLSSLLGLLSKMSINTI